MAVVVFIKIRVSNSRSRSLSLSLSLHVPYPALPYLPHEPLPIHVFSSYSILFISRERARAPVSFQKRRVPAGIKSRSISTKLNLDEAPEDGNLYIASQSLAGSIHCVRPMTLTPVCYGLSFEFSGCRANVEVISLVKLVQTFSNQNISYSSRVTCDSTLRARCSKMYPCPCIVRPRAPERSA